MIFNLIIKVLKKMTEFLCVTECVMTITNNITNNKPITLVLIILKAC